MTHIKANINDPYIVKTTANTTKDADTSSRTVSGLFGTYFYIDSDKDMLLTGCAKKSISERGVGCKKGNKIKHLKDHEWSENIARIDVLEEREVEFEGRSLTGIYHESFYPESTDSNDMLIKIAAGLYDARSIGYQYENIIYCSRDSDDIKTRENYDKYIQLAINPEEAERDGYFWAVKEIRLWEGSDVSFGANELTPLLGVKGINKPDVLATKAVEKLDVALKMMKSGNLSDDGFHTLNMEITQIKQYIRDLLSAKANKKDTLKHGGRPLLVHSGAEFLKNLT